MSVSYTAKAFWGVEIDPASLYVEREVHGCSHAIRATDAFCPECGKPAIIRCAISRAEYDDDQETLAGLKVVAVGLSRVERLFVAGSPVLSAGADGGNRVATRLPPEDAARGQTARAECRAALEPLGLWDEAKYGLWCVLEAS